ncbi:MAG: Activator of Hsp90 ATPase 1 family protein [Bacteroidetes bacterium]|nr:Activator of Hsp90 ATPase 1 family protein [Bacteroidota bacterium]
MEKFKITVKLNCKAKDVFIGWLNSKTHSAFTGGAEAKMSSNEGGIFSAHNGYITGTNIEIFPHKKIIQKWRTKDFDEKDEDSIIELFFTQKEDYTLVSLSHTNIPDGQGDKYKKGWKDFYFTFMKKYYDN